MRRIDSWKTRGPGGKFALCFGVGELPVWHAPRNITFQRDHSSVRENLDGLVNVSRKKIWVVTFVDSFIPTATGFHRTQTLWNNNAVSESEQPVWNMFSWDEPLPSVGLNAYQH
jgi:hypothetical protein